MSGWAHHPAREARLAGAAAHAPRPSRKLRSTPQDQHRVYAESVPAWPVPIWWFYPISTTFHSPLHQVFANVSNPAPMHWRLAALQRQNLVAVFPLKENRAGYWFIAGYCSGTLAAAS